jgi:hypothetical protein
MPAVKGGAPVSLLSGSGATPAGPEYRPARSLTSRLGGGGAGIGSGSRCTAQPRDVTAPVWAAAAEDSAPLWRMAGWRRPSRQQWMALGALVGLADEQRLR